MVSIVPETPAIQVLAIEQGHPALFVGGIGALGENGRREGKHSDKHKRYTA